MINRYLEAKWKPITIQVNNSSGSDRVAGILTNAYITNDLKW